MGQINGYWRDKRALVTGGSSGLGLHLAQALVNRGAKVSLCARRQGPLDEAAQMLRALGGDVQTLVADVSQAGQSAWAVSQAVEYFGGIDLVCPCAGRSMRGTVADTPREEFESLLAINFLAAQELVRAALPHLAESNGHAVLIGSLASRVAPRFLGAYPASKFPLAALAQQLRLEQAENGVHTLLVCPGPIARPGDPQANQRYQDQAAGLPSDANKPGGGAKVTKIDPDWLAERILRGCERRKAELVVPAKARLLFALSQLSPRLGDWLLRKKSG